MFRRNIYKLYTIIYKKEKKENDFVVNNVILLVKNEVLTKEVKIVTGRYVDVEEDVPYCVYNFESIYEISKNCLILKYNSKIVSTRDQDYFYIIDKLHKDGDIYYKIYLDEDKPILLLINETNKKSFLIKNENTNLYYFLYSESEEASLKSLEKYFQEQKLILKKIKYKKDLCINNFYIQKNTIIGLNDNNIYYGKVFGDTLEKIENINMNSNQIIKYISIEEKIIFYEQKGKEQEEEDPNERSIIQEEENMEDEESKERDDD